VTLAETFSLSGSRAVVTGGGRGLGAGITESLLAAGADVVLMQRSKPTTELYDAAGGAGRQLLFHPVDLGEPDAVESVAQEVLAAGPVDILVNNAGTQFRAPAAEFPLDKFDELMQVNLRAVFRLTQLFGAPMLDRDHGRVVNVASLLSFQGGLTVPAYAASKGAVAQLTKAFSNEWASRGVTVNAVAPGYMATDLNEALLADPVRSRQISERIPIGRWGVPADIGASVVFLCSPAAAYITGIVLPVDGGWLAR
jgi:2-dehydro-3-deoxy-D-gluconate 5-dehydrogenase